MPKCTDWPPRQAVCTWACAVRHWGWPLVLQGLCRGQKGGVEWNGENGTGRSWDKQEDRLYARRGQFGGQLTPFLGLIYLHHMVTSVAQVHPVTGHRLIPRQDYPHSLTLRRPPEIKFTLKSQVQLGCPVPQKGLSSGTLARPGENSTQGQPTVSQFLTHS